MQDTPDSRLNTVPVGVGGVCAVHAVPFHRSAKGSLVPLLFTKFPTLVQALAAVHDADASWLAVAPVGVGVEAIDQLVTRAGVVNDNSLPKLVPDELVADMRNQYVVEGDRATEPFTF